MNSAKAAWEVRAGVIPELPDANLTRQWWYTSDDYEQDCKLDSSQPTKFTRYRDEAAKYALELQDPRGLNWVSVTWIWY